MLEQGDRRSAIRIMRRWTRAHPHDPAHRWMYVALARALAEDQKQEEAAAAFEDALKHNALNRPQDLRRYADLLFQLNKPERAMDLYRQVLKSRPDPMETEWAQVQIMLNSGGKKRTEGRPTGERADTVFQDPLFQRAAGAMQIGLKSAIGDKGR